ncbi:MAG: Gmad2 immunoglobulin-like domain-containing protein [Thermoanaerobaculia bacterium]
MRRLTAFLTTGLFLACASPDPAPQSGGPVPPETTSTSAETSPATPPAPARPDSAPPAEKTAPEERSSPNAGNVVLESPAQGVTVGNPVAISGRARTFENHVGIRVEDPAGHVLRTSYATARGELGEFNPFSAEVYLTTDPGRSIRVVIFESSAKDGSIRSEDSAVVRVRNDRSTLKLHFPNASKFPNDCSRVGQVVRNLPTSIAPARLAIEALLEGPHQSEEIRGFSSPFPEGSQLRSIKLTKGTVTVDFNERLQNVGGSCRALGIRSAVEQTMLAIDGIERVVITADGSEPLALQP